MGGTRMRKEPHRWRPLMAVQVIARRVAFAACLASLLPPCPANARQDAPAQSAATAASTSSPSKPSVDHTPRGSDAASGAEGSTGGIIQVQAPLADRAATAGT